MSDTGPSSFDSPSRHPSPSPHELSVFASRDAPKVSWGDLFIDIQARIPVGSHHKKEVLSTNYLSYYTFGCQRSTLN